MFLAEYEAVTPILIQGGGTASPGPTVAVSTGVSARNDGRLWRFGAGEFRSCAICRLAVDHPSKSASSGVRLPPALAELAGMLAVLAVLA